MKVMPGVEIFSGFTLLYAENTVEMMEGSKLKSSKRTMCNLNKHAHDMYTCLGKNALKADKIEKETVLKRFEKMYPSYDTSKAVFDMHNMWTGLHANYSSYVMALGDAKLSGASIEGPRIGLCAANVEMTDSLLQTSGHGCVSDFGLGSGE